MDDPGLVMLLVLLAVTIGVVLGLMQRRQVAVARDAASALIAERDRLRDQLRILGPAAERGLTPDGSHTPLPDGYCPDCGGGCLRGFAQPVRLVEPSPFTPRRRR